MAPLSNTWSAAAAPSRGPERFRLEWKRSGSYFASNFIGLGSLRDSGQADIALSAWRVGPPQRPHGAPHVIAQRAQAEADPRPLAPQVHQQPALPPPRELALCPRRPLLRPPGKAARLGRRHRDT